MSPFTLQVSATKLPAAISSCLLSFVISPKTSNIDYRQLERHVARLKIRMRSSPACYIPRSMSLFLIICTREKGAGNHCFIFFEEIRH